MILTVAILAQVLVDYTPCSPQKHTNSLSNRIKTTKSKMTANTSSTISIYYKALRTAVQNSNAMLWFKTNVYDCARYDKGKYCTICFDGNMVHILNKSAFDMGHSHHSIVTYHNEEDSKVWHRTKVVDGIPNIYHADAVCNNTNITCGECISIRRRRNTCLRIRG